MGVTDGCPAESKSLITNSDRFLQDLAGFSCYGNIRTPKADLAHLHLNPFPLIQHQAADQTSLGFNTERLFFNKLAVPEIPAKYSQAVTAFFRFTAIGIEDTQSQRGFWRRQGTKKDSVRPDAIISVANDPDPFRGEFDGLVLRVQNQIIVAQSVIFVKFRPAYFVFSVAFLKNES